LLVAAGRCLSVSRELSEKKKRENCKSIELLESNGALRKGVKDPESTESVQPYPAARSHAYHLTGLFAQPAGAEDVDVTGGVIAVMFLNTASPRLKTLLCNPHT
jgi:hypothetical protein